MMKHARLELARSAQLLPPLSGNVAVFGQIELDRLRGLSELELRCESSSYVTNSALSRASFDVSPDISETCEHAIVFLPRSKSEALHLIARAVATVPNGWVIVDGQKTDGIESIAKQISKEAKLAGTYSKGHGKTIWFQASDAQDLGKWIAEPTRIDQGFLTAPGVFSADGIDPASAFLLEHVPTDISGVVADLGAGWGYLTAGFIDRMQAVSAVHMIEDNAAALECAKANVKDQRAQFHWGDALTWTPPEPIQTIVMNPPFHKGRNAEPKLGIDFIQSSARILRPGGMLYMVANAHLPYETTLEQSFEKVELLARTTRFKIFCAQRGRAKLR